MWSTDNWWSGATALTREGADAVARQLIEDATEESIFWNYKCNGVDPLPLGESIWCLDTYYRRGNGNPVHQVREALRVQAPPGRNFAARMRWLLLTAQPLAPLAEHIDDDYVLTVVMNLCSAALYSQGTVSRMWTPLEAQSHAHLARWAQYQFPIVRVGAKQAAALALSELSQDQLATVRPPWPVFVVHFGDAFRNADSTVLLAMLSRLQSRFSSQGPSGRKLNGLLQGQLDVETPESLWVYEGTASEWYDHPMEPNENQLREAKQPAQLSAEVRLRHISVRALLNVCVALDAKAATLDRIKRKPPRRRKKRRRKPAPAKVDALHLASQYTFGMPVSVNVVQHVQSYLKGDTGRACKVRWIVRGYWRDQAYGPRHSLRRRQWIAPHPAGRKGASRLVREHALVQQSSNEPQTVKWPL